MMDFASASHLSKGGAARYDHSVDREDRHHEPV